MRTILILLCLCFSGVTLADSANAFGTYLFERPRKGVFIYDSGESAPSCGLAALKTLLSMTALEVTYDGTVTIKGETWPVESAGEKGVTARMPRPVNGSTLKVFFGKGRRVWGLMLVGTNDSKECIDIVTYKVTVHVPQK